MIAYKKYPLKNGLRLIAHQDQSTEIAAVNMMYDVGSRDEHPEMTGLAHLFEHLMFEGSENVPVFDRELEKAGGENNAFTNSDITNYYITLPDANLETALWLESDRMAALAMTQEKLDIQKSVVVEEFKERYLNQPYGDLWALTRDLSYSVHPYKWTTIGKEIGHIEKVCREDALKFYNKFYAPDNAVLSITSPRPAEEVYELVSKWFDDIAPAKEKYHRNLPGEPPQKEHGFRKVEKDVPSSMLVKTYHMADRLSPEYYVHDLISDVLANGESSRLKTTLVKQQELFSQIDAYISGDRDPGLLMITGRVNDHVDIEEADKAVQKELQRLANDNITGNELQKVKNKALTRMEEEKNGILEKAMNFAYSELLGDPELFIRQNEYYKGVDMNKMGKELSMLFAPYNGNTLYYKAK